MNRFALVLSLVGLAALVPAAPAVAGSTQFIGSAVEHADNTVTLPLQRGTSHGDTVWYLVLDSSAGNDADRRQVNTAQKLGNARGSGAVQRVTVSNGVVDFPGTVDFSYDRNVLAPAGFPPIMHDPGARGDRATRR